MAKEDAKLNVAIIDPEFIGSVFGKTENFAEKNKTATRVEAKLGIERGGRRPSSRI